jgi:hypothetical protein
MAAEKNKDFDLGLVVEQISFLEELYVARCKDTLEQPSREEFLRFNSRLKSRCFGAVCSLRNQHLGVSAANTLSKFLRNRTELVKLDLYCNLVRDHGLQVVSHLLHLNPSIHIFNIGCNDLSDKAGPYLAEIISYDHLRSLQVGITEKALHPNKLTAMTLDAISGAVIKSSILKALGLNGSALAHKPVPNIPSADIALTRMLSKSSSLEMIRLSACELTSQMVLEVINNGLCFNSVLKRIDISDNGLSPAVGIRLAEYLLEPVKEMVIPPDEGNPDIEGEIVVTSKSPHLFYLDVSKNQFTPAVAIAFAETLTVYPYLGYLDLSFNEIENEGAVRLAAILETNQTLVELHMAANAITSVGGIAIAEALKTNRTLTTLNISKNKLGDATAFALADALTTNPTMSAVYIASALLSNEGGIKLAEASIHCQTLVTLDMSDNFFTEGAGGSMEKLFRENPCILRIDVSGTQINHFSFHALNEICARNAAMLKQKEQKPLRNQLVKSQYSVVELQRKEAILSGLNAQRSELQEEIDKLDEQIHALKSDEEANATMLSKQIQERELQMKNDRTDFEEKMKKLEEDLKEFEQKKAEITLTLEGQLSAIQDTKTKTDEKKAILQKMTADFESGRSAKLKEIDEINGAADALLKLAQDQEALAAMEELPEFMIFEDDLKIGLAEERVAPAKPRKGRGKKKKGQK